jgi:methyl-accepting chemotaxis protein
MQQLKSFYANLGIRTKLIVLLVLVGPVPMATASFLSYHQASGTLAEKAGTEQSEVAFNAIDKLDRNLFERYGDVQAFAGSDPAKSMDARRIQTWMDTTMGIYTPIYKLMVVADTHGRIIAANRVTLDGKPLDTTSLIGKDVSGEAWFKTAAGGKLADAETFVEDLHEDPLMRAVYGDGQKSLAMNYTYPIKDDAGKIVGVWSNRFNWEVAESILGDVLARAKANGGETQRFFLVNKAGTVLHSFKPEQTLKTSYADTPVVKLALHPKADGDYAGKALDGSGDARIFGYHRSVGYSTYPGVGWAVVSSRLRSEALASASALARQSVIVAVIAAALMLLIAVLFSGAIKRGIEAILVRIRQLSEEDSAALENALGEIAGGNLTVTVTPVTPPIENVAGDEIGQVAAAVNGIRDSTASSMQAYNEMATQLRSLVGDLSGSATSVASASQQMASTSDEAGRAVGEIASAAGDVAQGAERQARMVESTSASAAEAAGAAQESAQQAQETCDVAEQTRSVTREGVVAADQATAAMRAVHDSSMSATQTITDLSSKSDQIGGIVQTITGIAEQTNLLALNAAIEAARAGEQGRGFAVVAEEVRKLAEESSEAAALIARLIQEIQAETHNAVAAVEDGAKRTEAGVATVEQTREAFERIETAIDDISGRVQQIAASVRGIAEDAERMQTEIAEVASVAEASSASSEQVSASAQQTSASTQEIAASAAELAGTAEELERLVGQFRVAA